MRIRKNPEERRIEILDTAFQLFYENGYESTSLTDIAKKIGIAHGLIYNYFSSKEELYDQAVERFVQETKSDYLALFSRDISSVEDFIDLTREVFSSKRDSGFYKYYRKKGNENVYYIVMIKLFSALSEPLAIKISTLANKLGYHIKDPQLLIEFILFGQIPIFKDSQDISEKKKQIKEYIITLLGSKTEPS